MFHPFPGFFGILAALGILGLAFYVAHQVTLGAKAFEFDAKGQPGAFEPLLSIYLKVAEVIVGLAAGSIVLVVSSAVLRPPSRLPWLFASPLVLLAAVIVYAVLFMVFLTTAYEGYRHDEHSYTRFKYMRNQAFGYAGLGCFCVGYVWLIFVVAR